MGLIKKLFFALTILFIGIQPPNVNALIYLSSQSYVPNSKEFIGKWDMKTIVIDSNCTEIIVGSTTESELTIHKYPGSDHLQAIWEGGIWKSSTSVLMPLSENEFLTERLTEINLDNENHWMAELVDHLSLKDNNLIHTESIVKQYKNNELIGEYKTFSILTKIIE